MHRCRDCHWILNGNGIGCLKFAGLGRFAEIEQMKNVLSESKCEEFTPKHEGKGGE